MLVKICAFTVVAALTLAIFTRAEVETSRCDRDRVSSAIYKLAGNRGAKKCQMINLLLTKISSSECPSEVRSEMKRQLAEEFGLKTSPTFLDCRQN